MTLNVDLLLAFGSVLLLVVLTGFFLYAVRHQDSVEPKTEQLEGVALLRQHYPAGATIEQPTPYFVAPIPSSPDPLESAANLDKKVFAGAGMLFALLVLTGGYFALTPTVQARGAENQLQQRVVRGQSIYTNLCFDCHGKQGEGINGAGLPLNISGNKYEVLAGDPNPAVLKDREAALRLAVSRGRAKPAGQLSMPAWARSEGGPLNDEQINQILAFIEHGTDAEWADVVHLRQELGLALEPQTPKPEVVTGAAGGLRLVQNNPQQACTTCHSFDAGKPSTLPLAPNLSDYGVKGPLSDELKALRASGDADWLAKWIANAPSVKAGIAMPPFAERNNGKLTDDNIKAIVEYLLTLGTGKEPK